MSTFTKPRMKRVLSDILAIFHDLSYHNRILLVNYNFYKKVDISERGKEV